MPIVLFTRYPQQVQYSEIPIISSPENAFSAVRALYDYREFVKRTHVPVEAQPAARRDAILEMLSSVKPKIMVGYESDKFIGHYGLTVAPEDIARTEDEAILIASKIGYPVVLKLASARLLHKSEAGGVVLNINKDEQLRTAYRNLQGVARKEMNGESDGVLVQKMMNGGVEIILGMVKDPKFGVGVLFGVGGIFAELFRDFSIRMIPLTIEDIHDMIDETNAGTILRGFRGFPKKDINALVQDVVSFSELCNDIKDYVDEMEINPLLVFEDGKGTCIADSRIIFAQRVQE